ncbi:hypothetical protein HNQ54_001538 [Anaerocolumna cellulosilytica]|nr:hypothetical protein [Anaerocolumna cellulosilytica]
MGLKGTVILGVGCEPGVVGNVIRGAVPGEGVGGV